MKIFNMIKSLFSLNVKDNLRHKVFISVIAAIAGAISSFFTLYDPPGFFTIGFSFEDSAITALIFGSMSGLSSYGFLIAIEQAIASWKLKRFRRNSNNVLEM